jgi:Methylamine utilisation protein MauE
VSAAYQQIVGAAAAVAGTVVIAAGLPKVIKPGLFAAQIADYGIAPPALTGFLARVIPLSELLAGGLLLTGLAGPRPVRQAGAGLAMVLFAAFLAALASAYARGRDIACACFGGDSELETVSAHSIVRTGLLFVLAAVAALPAAGGRPFDIAGLAVILAVLVALASELTRLLGPLRRATAALVEELAGRPAAADNPKAG